MHYRNIRKRIVKLIESDYPSIKKYLRIRKLLTKQINVTPLKPKWSGREKVSLAIPILRKILVDVETPQLMKQFFPNADLSRTQDFILFLEKVTQDDENKEK